MDKILICLMWLGYISGVLGLLLQIKEIVCFLKSFRTKLILVGKQWFSYHITISGSQETFREGIWKFNKNKLNKVTVLVKYPDTEKTYRGSIVSRARDLCINLNGEGFDEFVSIRLMLQLHPEGIFDGVWFGPDENGDLRTDFWFLTQRKMTRDTAEEYIQEGRKRVLSKPIH